MNIITTNGQTNKSRPMGSGGVRYHHVSSTTSSTLDTQSDDGGCSIGKHPLEICSQLDMSDDEIMFHHQEQGTAVEISGMSKLQDTTGECHKTIGKLGSFAIAVNALAGPGILQLPYTYQQAGIIPTTAALLLVGLLSALCCMHTANVVSKVPGNANFDNVVEFSDPYRTFWNERAYAATQVIFYLCTLCVNIAAIVDTAQIVDSFCGHSALGTAAYSLDDNEIQTWIHTTPCTRQEVKLGQCLPFQNDGEQEYGNALLTMGYVITTAVFLPICLMDLKENTAWQIFGFCVLMTVSAQFVLCFYADGLDTANVSMWGDNHASMLGVIMFNFGLVMAIPSWLAEKKEAVSVSRVVYGSTGISLFLYIAVGLLGALSIPNVNANALEPMTSGAFGQPLRIGGSIFAFFIIGLDIPLFAVLTRYNLVNSGLCSRRLANLLVVYLPWSLSWLFYQGSSISELLSWGGILFTGALAFILPLYLAIRVLGMNTVTCAGSVDVYLGLFKSQTAERQATIVVFVVSFACVATAIIGQLECDEEREYALTHSPFMNGTSVDHN